MGIIKRQGIRHSLVTYLGVIIGGISSIFIYPLINQDELGIIQFVLNTSILLVTFAGFSSSTMAVHFFPVFKNPRTKNNGFLFLLLLFTFVACTLFLLAVYFSSHIVFGYLERKIIFSQTLPFLLVFTSLNSFIVLLIAYSSVFNRIVVPSIFYNILIKIAQPLLIFLMAKKMIGLTGALYGLGFALGVSLISLIFYTIHLKQFHWRPNFKFVTPTLMKSMFSYASFSILVSLGSLLSSKIDQFFIPNMLGYAALPIFNFGMFISEAIDIPRKAFSGIAAPLISESMKKENYAHVEEIYKKSSLIQFIAGLYLLIGVWVCADNLFQLMPKNGDLYHTGKYVILILGISRLVDMATGLNTEIITYSRYYRFNFISLSALAVLTIVLNLILIPKFGIIGSAFATLVSITIVNVWRLFYIKSKINVQPLDNNMISAFIIGVITYAIAYFLPSLPHPILNILWKGSIVTILYGVMIIRTQVSPDINQIWEQIKTKLPL